MGLNPILLSCILCYQILSVFDCFQIVFFRVLIEIITFQSVKMEFSRLEYWVLLCMLLRDEYKISKL